MGLVSHVGILVCAQAPVIIKSKRNTMLRMETKLIIWYRAPSGIEAFKVKGLNSFGAGMYYANDEGSCINRYIDMRNHEWSATIFNELKRRYLQE
jgi:hypothetical protein